jgi:peptidoglycan/xylan/chitin deacetylase (PgdA/CDA1 family)
VNINEVVYDCNDDSVVKLLHQVTWKKEKKVILTSDDGPSRCLPAILDVLKNEKVPAMFFWQTRLLHFKRPWQRLLDEGHRIGSHTCKHPNLTNMTYEQQYNELLFSKQKIERITGQKVEYFRPPFGRYDDRTLKGTQQLDMVPVMWRISSMDWEYSDNPSQIKENVLVHLEDGAIILLHELKQTLQVLPEIIRKIKDRGYTFTLLPKDFRQTADSFRTRRLEGRRCKTNGGSDCIRHGQSDYRN